MKVFSCWWGTVGECCQNEEYQLSGLVHNNGRAIFKLLWKLQLCSFSLQFPHIRLAILFYENPFSFCSDVCAWENIYSSKLNIRYLKSYLEISRISHIGSELLKNWEAKEANQERYWITFWFIFPHRICFISSEDNIHF